MTRLLATAVLLISATQSFGEDQPVITVSREALAPRAIAVHMGEVIRWRAVAGEYLRLSLDDHPKAHEVVVRSGEIQAVFLRPGLHTYKVSLDTDGRRVLHGTVIVKEAEAPVEGPLVCAPGGFVENVCFEP